MRGIGAVREQTITHHCTFRQDGLKKHARILLVAKRQIKAPGTQDQAARGNTATGYDVVALRARVRDHGARVCSRPQRILISNHIKLYVVHNKFLGKV